MVAGGLLGVLEGPGRTLGGLLGLGTPCRGRLRCLCRGRAAVSASTRARWDSVAVTDWAIASSSASSRARADWSAALSAVEPCRVRRLGLLGLLERGLLGGHAGLMGLGRLRRQGLGPLLGLLLSRPGGGRLLGALARDRLGLLQGRGGGPAVLGRAGERGLGMGAGLLGLGGELGLLERRLLGGRASQVGLGGELAGPR